MSLEQRYEILKQLEEARNKVQELVEKCYDESVDEMDTQKLRDTMFKYRNKIDDLCDEIDMLVDVLETEY